MEPFSIVLYTNMAVSLRGCKPRIETGSFFLFQHYLDLDLAKYEPSLYMNVEEIDATTCHTTSPDNGKIPPGDDTLRDTNTATEQMTTKL